MAKAKPNPILSSLPGNIRSKVTYLEDTDIYIIELDPKTLHENPKNWRVHTRRQRDTYTAFKSKFGWLGTILYNVATSRLLDGHMRVDEAIKNKEPLVPVILKHLTEEEENEVLATLDNVGLLAKRNQEALQSLLKSNQDRLATVKDKNSQKLKQLQQDLQSHQESVLLPQAKTKVRPAKPEPEEEPEDEDLESGTYEPPPNDGVIGQFVNDDILFPGITDLDIPELISGKLADPKYAPIRTYLRDSYGTDAFFCISSGPFNSGEPIGTLGFYTEDYRFEDSYKDGSTFAEYLQELDPACVLTPDFSTYSDWPFTLRAYNLYRARWCGRFWQELGFNIIPSLQSLGTDELNSEYVLETLPTSTPVLSMQCRKAEVATIIHFIKHTVEHRVPEVFLLYGGEEKQKYLHGHLPKKVGKKTIDYRYLPNYVEKTRRMKKRK